MIEHVVSRTVQCKSQRLF